VPGQAIRRGARAV